jgi:hypothetical protein
MKIATEAKTRTESQDLRCVFGILKQKANDFESQIAYNECRLPSNGSSSKDQKVHFEITKGMILQMCWW